MISKTNKKNLKFLGWVPEDIDLFNYEFEDAIESYENNYKIRKVFIHDYPENIFSKTLIHLIPLIFDENDSNF